MGSSNSRIVYETHDTDILTPKPKPKPSKQTKKPTSRRKVNTTNEALVLKYWCEASDNQDSNRIRKVCSPSACCYFKDAEQGMSFNEFLGTCEMIWSSFPDNHMTWESVEEVSPGTVFVKNYKGRGHHTGPPYSFGPYPPIPAKGRYVDEDPCHLIITVLNRKITKFVIDTYQGDLVGPPGYYEKIGGDLSQPMELQVL